MTWKRATTNLRQMMRANRMAMMNDDGSEPWDPYSGNKQ